MNRLLALTLAFLLPLVAACGQKASTRGGAISPAPVVSGPLHPMHGQDMMLSSSPDLRCGSRPVVWANSHTKVYHMQGDPYYGHTKFGGYACEQDAVRAGYRPAKTPAK